MNFQQLLGSWSQNGAVVTINATTAPSLAAFLGQFYPQQGSQITITNASITQDTQAQTVQITGSGTADALSIAGAMVTVTLFLDAGGNLIVSLTYTLLSPTVSTGWKFSTSFPNLPKGPASTPGGAPSPALLDTLPLISAQFVVASAAYTDPTSGAAVPAGISFQGQLQPAGLISALDGVLPTAPVPLTGVVIIPTSAASIPVPIVPTTQNIGATQAFPWDVTPPLPGIHLSAPLASTLPLGKASITGTCYRVYSPTANNWPADPLLEPIAAVTGTLALPSAGISATAFVTVDRRRTGTAAFVDVRVQGLTLAKLEHLADIAGGSAGNLLGSLPSSLTSTAQALSSFGLTELVFSILAGPEGLTVEAVGIAVGAPGTFWSVWRDGEIKVGNLVLGFLVTGPMSASPTVTVKVDGTAIIAGAAVDIAASVDTDGNTCLAATLQDGVTLPLSSLLSTHVPGFSGVAAPGDLTIDTLRASIDPTGLRLGGGLAGQQSKPWTVAIGPTNLQLSKVSFDLVVPASGSPVGLFSGTLDLGGVTLTLSQQVPGPVRLKATCPSINLKHLVSSLTGGADFLPSDLDFTLKTPSILIDLGGSIPTFQVAAQVDRLGTVVFEAVQVNGAWGFVFGVALAGKMSSVPGLAELAALEDLIALNGLTLVAASVVPPSFSFPGLAVFNNPALGASNLSAPTSGLIAGLNLYGSVNLGQSSGLDVVRKFLGLSPETVLAVAVQVGTNPALNSALTASISGQINSKVSLTGTLGAALTKGSPSLFLNANVTAPIQGQSCVFTATTLIDIAPPGAFLAGTMKGSVNFSGITLSDLGLVVGVGSDGLPSLGMAATVTMGKFNGAAAMFFDSADPSQSMLAGSVSDLSLKDVADTMAGVAGFSVPPEIGGALAQVQVSGTQSFTLPLGMASDLDRAVAKLDATTAAAVSTDLHSAGIDIPADPKNLLITRSAAPGTWFITDLSSMRHYELVQGASSINGSINCQLYVAPQATSIGTFKYPQGFYLNGKLSFWGRSLTATIQVSQSKGLSIDAGMSSIVIQNSTFFSITGADGTGGPRLSIATYTQPNQPDAMLRPPHLLISGRLTLLGSSQSLYVSIGTKGLAFNATFTGASSMVTWKVDGSVTGSGRVSAAGDINVNLKNVPPLDLGQLGKIKLNTSLGGSLSLSHQPGIGSASLVGTVVLSGQTFNVSLPNLTEKKLDDLPQLVADALKPVIQAFLSDMNHWLDWIKNGTMQGVSSVAQIADVLAMKFNQGIGDIASALTQVGYDAIAICKGLAKLGYKAADIASALKTLVFEPVDIIKGLKAAAFAIIDVGNVLKSVFSKTYKGAASLLNDAAYGPTEIAEALSEVYTQTFANMVVPLSPRQVAEVLRDLKIYVDDISNALKSVYNTTDDDMASILKHLGYTSKEVARTLKSVWRDTDDEMGKALKSAGYGITDVASALKSVGGLSYSSVKSILTDLGYSWTDILEALDAVF